MNCVLTRLPDFLLLGIPVLASTTLFARSAPPEHAVIFIIDGLSYKAVDRLPLDNLRRLIAAGTYYEKSYTVMPAHPQIENWLQFSQASIPNPVLLAGTVLLRTGQKYVQQSFFPDRITAHVANDLAYTTLNVGFHLTYMGRADDRQAIAWAIEFLRRERPAFMLIHLQNVGDAGYASYTETDLAVPWRGNIWAEGSPYRKAALQADKCLGMLLDELTALGLREKTAFFVTADHGEADSGWHRPEEQDGWAMPLVVAGPGIRPAQRFPYSEQIDIVPTLCFLMGVKPPPNADGRILAEALMEPPEIVAPRRQKILELNTLLLEVQGTLKKLRQKAEESPAVRKDLAEAEREFYGLDRILEWHRFGSLDGLLEHNRNVLAKLSAVSSGTR
jgi:hypothetical protein